MEDLQARHRKEQKDLQGRITQKKKNATKKTRKGVNDECERLERELTERHRAEIDALDMATVAEPLEDLQIDEPAPMENHDLPENVAKGVTFSSTTRETAENTPQEPQRSKKPNRQKARLARRAAEQEAQVASAAEEAANLPDLREQETKAMNEHKKQLELTETFIRPDGHCLFSACAKVLPADVVKESGPFTEGYQNVRFATANFMAKHREDFEAFLEEPFDDYVIKIKDTAEWGGQLELQAISRSYGVTVRVLQADGRIETFEPDQNGTTDGPVWLAYYRHSFGLGEHYNALSKARDVH